jgi:hypothetical protein
LSFSIAFHAALHFAKFLYNLTMKNYTKVRRKNMKGNSNGVELFIIFKVAKAFSNCKKCGTTLCKVPVRLKSKEKT